MPRNDAFLDHLAEVPLFSALSRKELALVAKRAEDVKVQPGKVLVTEGSTGSEFFVIIDGNAKVSRRGRKVATLGPGQWYGEREVFLRVPADEEVFAEGEVILWTISPDTLRDLFFSSPAAVQLLFNFGILLAQKLAAKTPAPATAP